MSKKVYIVSDGWYSEYQIKGIFSTREKAEELQKHFPSPNDIEEIELDPEIPYPSDQLAYRVFFGYGGDVNVTRANSEDVNEKIYRYLGESKITHVFAINEEDAKEKARAKVFPLLQ